MKIISRHKYKFNFEILDNFKENNSKWLYNFNRKYGRKITIKSFTNKWCKFN